MTDALLLSGGIDSIALLYWLQPQLAISIDYGQIPAEGEIAASRAVCEHTNTKHYVISADCSAVGCGTMSGKSIPFLKSDLALDRPEWWPYRNQLIVTLAAAYLVPQRVSRLLIGTVREDEAHGDGTAAFIQAMNTTLLAQEGCMTFDAPAINLSSEELVLESGVPLSLLAWSHSCHIANIACGLCRGCVKAEQVLDAVRKLRS